MTTAVTPPPPTRSGKFQTFFFLLCRAPLQFFWVWYSNGQYSMSNINRYIIVKPYQISQANEHSDIWYGFHTMYLLILDILYNLRVFFQSSIL